MRTFGDRLKALLQPCVFLLALSPLLFASPSLAQFELQSGTFNDLWVAPSAPPVDNGSTTTTPQFSGHAGTSATSGPVADGSVSYVEQYPSAKTVVGVTVTATIVMLDSSVGGVFASGVPRYALGDEILPPATGIGTIGEVPASYWRGRPVEAGEQFTNPGSATPVDTDPLPPTVPYSYYYSLHAKKVFAHQAGRVSVLWVTQQPVGPNGTTDAGDNPKEFRFRQEIFSVSSGTTRPVRTIYWTERSFNGPKVNIPTGRIVTVNAAYNLTFPQTVAEEYAGVGVIPGDPNATPPPELRTLWFENTAGLGQLHAYNREGRVLVEYLGTLQGGGGTPTHEFLGADIVEVVQAAPPTTATVKLGEQILPHDVGGGVPWNAEDYLPSVVLNLGQDGVTYYGTSARPDGQLIYHAEWENDNPDKVTFYWLEEQDAAIHFLDSPSVPNLGIAWPKYLNKYLQVWPGPLSEYAGVTVTDTGSTAEIGVQFSGGSLPDIVHQDDGAQTEVGLDLATQRLVVDFSQSLDKTNRSLLKFSTGSSVWYQRLFIQSQSVLGSPAIPEVPDPDGGGPLEGTPAIPAVYTLADRDADGIRDLSVAAGTAGHEVVVGQRIERPSSAYEVAGYIASGTGHLPAAYQDPFTAGVEAAAAGAIIPVNAVPGNDAFTIWWFTKVNPPNAGFEPFYVPSVSGEYQVSYPTNAERIVMASNAGTGDLGPSQAAGTIYFQNDPSQPGYNPNEEHALMLAGRAYALRDDLNVTSDPGYTSEPFVLISYVDPNDSRPAVEAYEVLDVLGDFDDATPGAAVELIASNRGNDDSTWFNSGSGGNSISFFNPGSESVLRFVTGGTRSITMAYALSGSGSGSTFNAPTNGDIYGGNIANDSATLEFVFRPSDHVGNECVYSTGGSTTGTSLILLDDLMVLTLGESGSHAAQVSAPIPASAVAGGDFVHVMAVFDDPLDQIELFVNGVSAGSATGIDPTTGDPAALNSWSGSGAAQLGRGGAGGSIASLGQSGTIDLVGVVGLTGEIAMLRIYPRVLTPAEIQQNASAGGGIAFDYPVTAGAQIPSPMPLPLLPLPINGNGDVANTEVDIPGGVDPAPDRTGPVTLYDRFTFEDRKGYTWVYRGPHASGTPSTGMQFYYTMLEGFFIPGVGTQPVVGAILPYLRPWLGDVPQGDPVNGTSRTIHYRPVWPDATPELRVAETLTLAKFGLPQVRGQTSTEVLYQQSIANNGSASTSVTLHDPTRAKKVVLGADALDIMDNEIATTIYNGRTYFQRVPPHLQQRLYANPILGGAIELVLEGEFMDEIAGEDYLNLNVLSTADIAALKDLDNNVGTAWDSAVDALVTAVETFVEDPTKKGTYKVGSTATVGEDELAEISDSDTAVDSYALTATGQGTGYVSLLFGDGEAFTPEGDPVSIGVIRVAPQLYVGDMKTIYSSNPLDEQVTLRHSGDFAANADDYEFEWRYAPLADGLPPATYLYGAPVSELGNGWALVQNPAGVLPSAAEDGSGSSVTTPRTLTIHDANFGGGDVPGAVLKSDAGVDFTGGLPAQVIFSADLSNDLDGFVLYVNGIETLAFRAPASFVSSNATTGLSASGLGLQFNLSPNYFSAGVNTIEVALYSDADPLVTSQVNFRLESVSRTDRVDPAEFANSPWQEPATGLENLITLGGSPTAPLGNPVLLLQDNAFTVRYRPKLSSGNILTAEATVQDDVEWSDWMDAQVVPGWIKRVLDAINPFNQRVTDLFNNAVNTDVSVLTQAGTRWEGDIALNLDNVNDAGLIEIYETVLNRAKNFSIDNGYDVPGVNDALLLAAGYLNDLYVILGNEAYADAANPTISLDDQDTITEVNTSRFSFEGQVASSLEEELALLRGRDDFLATSVATAPAYNRLYWNYTNGIDSGEVLYAVNYNIKEKVGSTTQDGIIDAADAQRMFPQAHGDGYGHYVTALKGYYRLLTNDNFTWTPRAEVVTVLGQNVSVDYFDERKFAGAASNVARTAEQILALTWRQSYKDDENTGWEHFRDNKLNTRTNERRQWGMDEWASRATAGAYVNWMVGNALLPEEDTNPNHNGIQIVDRQTVPELAEVANAAASFQTTVDNANAHLNPLGLSGDAIAFDISPAELKAGNSHFEQVYQRALTAVLNAKGSFDQAGRMTRLLRNQDNQIDDYNTVIQDQERAFRYKLIDLFGTPYTADVGPGKTYAQGYDGPDLINWFLIDKASDLVEPNASLVDVEIIAPVEADLDETFDFARVFDNNDNIVVETKRVSIDPISLAQVADVFFGGPDAASGLAGERRVTGELQAALQSALSAQLSFRSAAETAEQGFLRLRRGKTLVDALLQSHKSQLEERDATTERITELSAVKESLNAVALVADGVATGLTDVSFAAKEFLPKVFGFSNDVTAPGRAALLTVGVTLAQISRAVGISAEIAAGGVEVGIVRKGLLSERKLEELDFEFEEAQLLYEFGLLFTEVVDQALVVAARASDYQQSLEHVRNVLARGDRLLAEREIFRLRAAAIIQGYRTRDVAFRAFRNEALEQYRTLFDLGARYTYLAAKSYDYETGLLGTSEGQQVINRIVASRALGDLTNGVPQATTSTLGDAGLAGTMAQLVADFAVAEGRLGINNPDQNGTLFSLRHELFRLGNDPNITADDEAWQQTLEQHILSDLRSDTDVMLHCQNIVKSDGSRVPGIVIPFSTLIEHEKNWFGLPKVGGDHSYSAAIYATKIYSAGMVLPGYVGMDPYTFGTPNAGSPATNDPDVLSASPYIYLIPTGADSMRAPPLGGTNAIRSWNVQDQALPLPYNLGASDFNGSQFFQANGTLSEQPWVVRKHQPFRAVDDPAFFYSLIPQEFTSSRLVGRSVWNSGWKIVIPAYTLLADEEEGLERFVRSVRDIQLFLRTYSNSGN